jgi:uncharacterized protein RhaS with RHS repeats
MRQLSFFRNRFYDQQSGRWTQEDPIGVAGGVNLYQFNGNNPVTFTDPFGLDPCRKALRRISFICTVVEALNTASSALHNVDKRFPDLPSAPGRTAGEVSSGVASDLKTGQGFSVSNAPTGSGNNPVFSGVSKPRSSTSTDVAIKAVVGAMPILAMVGGVTAAVAGVVMAIDEVLPEPELGSNPQMCRVEHCDGTQK